MEIALMAFGYTLAISVGINIFLYRKVKSLKSIRPESKELKEFLGDLLVGPSLVKVQRVDPSTIFLHNPERF